MYNSSDFFTQLEEEKESVIAEKTCDGNMCAACAHTLFGGIKIALASSNLRSRCGALRRVLVLMCVTMLGAANADDLKIQTTELPDGKVQAAYSATLEATGGTAPYTWTALPAMWTRETSTWAAYEQGVEVTGWRANDEVWELALPFGFPFYGKTYQTAYVNSNGIVYFEGKKNTSTYLQTDNVGLTAFGNRDLSTLTFGSEPCNIYVKTNSTDHVLIRWAAVSSPQDGGTSAQKPTVNFAVVLYPDGRIRFSYGSVTTTGKPDSATVFVGLRNGSETFGEFFSPNALSETQDTVLQTAVLPDGLTLAKDGTLSGTPTTVGAAGLVAQVKDATGVAATNYFPFTIEENPNEAPVVTGQTPAAEGATVKAGGKIAFAVTASDPEGADLAYTWKVNDVVTNTTSGAAWTWQTDPLDCGVYTVTCEVLDGERSVPVTWSVFVDRGFTWHVATNGGDDSNDGRDAARPFKTLAKALAAAGDGETILVGPGVYSEIDTSGISKTRLRVTDGKRLTIRATASDPAQTVIDGAGKANCLVFTETQTLSANVVVEGFTLRNGWTSDLAFGGGAFGGDLRRCVITNCFSKFAGGGAAYAKLTDCTIVGCTAASDGGGAYESEVVRCIVRGNVLTSSSSGQEGCGAGLAGGWARNTLIVENEIATTMKTGYGGAVCDTACTNCTIVANFNNAQTAYGGVAAKNAQKPCVNTIVYSNQGRENNEIYGLPADLCDGTIGEGKGLSQWTSFVSWSGRDFRLAAGSIAIDAGTGHFAADETDLDGAARVQGWAVDCGAYEYKTNFAVTGDAEAGFTVKVNTNETDFVASFPTSVDAENVTIEVSPEIKTVTPNGAAVKVVRTTENAAYDITECLDIPAAESGVINLAAATVKDEYMNPLDVTKGAKVDLRDPSAPSLTTAPTVPGLLYTLREGRTLDALADCVPVVGNGRPWTPDVTVKGGTSGFYTIRVSK